MYRSPFLRPPATDGASQAQSWQARRAVLMERIAGADERMAAIHGQQLADMAELRRGTAMHAGPEEKDVEHAQRSVTVELALKRTVAERTCGTHLDNAAALADRLPKTLAAMRAGTITWPKAKAILEETENLSREQCHQIEAGLLGRAPNLTPGNLRRATRKAVVRMDKDAAKKRAEAARRELGVEMWDNDNGTHTIQATLLSEDAIAVYGVTDTLARSAKDAAGPEDDRSIGEFRAAALTDRVLRPETQPAVSYEVGVIVPAGTLLGLGDEDGYLPGHGRIPAAVCRELAADSTWRRILTDPNTGHLLDLHPNRYEPADRLKAFIRTRDQHCRFPGCRRKATRCDIDHTIEFTIGGITVRINLGALCEHHHTIKHLPGWHLIQDPDGSGTLTFITPTGQMYRTRPPDLLTGEDPDTEILRWPEHLRPKPLPPAPPLPDDPPF